MIAAVAVLAPVLAIVGFMLANDRKPPSLLLPAPRDPVLPDLRMARLNDLIVGRSRSGGKIALLFTASIANVGPGSFVLRAVSTGSGGWSVTQRLRERGGGLSEIPIPGPMVFGGHGHEHWHIQLGATYELRTLAGGKVVRRYAKVGYCFFDQVRIAKTAAPPRFPRTTCGTRDTRVITMGLSPGWSDPYQWTLPDQRLDLTGVPAGRYRLYAKADPGGWFSETREENNDTWLDLVLTLGKDLPQVKVISVGPHLRPA